MNQQTEVSRITPNADRILRWPAVHAATGISRTAKDRLIRADLFPRPFALSPDPKCRAIGWSAIEIQKWIESRMATRGGA